MSTVSSLAHTSLSPLSLEQEQAAFQRFWEGDQQAGELLVRSNLRWAYIQAQEAGRQAPGRVELEDLFAVASKALWEAVCHYQQGYRVKLISYARHHIQHRLWAALACHPPARDPPVDWSAKELACYPQEEIERDWEQVQISGRLEEQLNKLPSSQQRVLRLSFGLGGAPPLSLATIGQQMGKSREWIRRLRNRGLAELREKLAGDPIINELLTPTHLNGKEPLMTVKPTQLPPPRLVIYRIGPELDDDEHFALISDGRLLPFPDGNSTVSRFALAAQYFHEVAHSPVDARVHIGGRARTVAEAEVKERLHLLEELSRDPVFVGQYVSQEPGVPLVVLGRGHWQFGPGPLPTSQPTLWESQVKAPVVEAAGGLILEQFRSEAGARQQQARGGR